MRFLSRIFGLFLVSLMSAYSARADGTSQRGFQIPLGIEEPQVAELASVWNVNLVRIQLGAHYDTVMDGVSGAEYLARVGAELDQLETLLPVLESHGMRAVVALYNTPGGFFTRSAPSHYYMFADAALQEEFIDVWEQIIQRFGDSSAVHGFDLANEPAMRRNLLCGDCRTWNDLALDTIEAIRAIDPDAVLMVKSLYGDPTKLAALPPINDEHIIYSYHAYPFLKFQQAGLYGNDPGVTRPTLAKIQQKLLLSLARFFAKQKAYRRARRVPSYPPRLNMGEAGQSSCALDDPAQYMDDLLSVIERDDIDEGEKLKLKRFSRALKKVLKDVKHTGGWTWHAFAEAPVWDPRYRCIDGEAGEFEFVGNGTDRSLVLQSYFSRNE